MLEVRKIDRIVRPETLLEGAGVKLRRSIATRTLNYVDPFLLLDHFDSDNPDDYRAGFPMHPHRGIETVTYMLSGSIDHRDSMGNSGRVTTGDVQWMTSGSGIMHEEMPDEHSGRMAGFQLWVNLPAKLKMSHPRYQDIRATGIPQMERSDGTMIRVVAGELDGVNGPVTGIAADPSYVDIVVPAHTATVFPVPRGHSAFSYLFEGTAEFGAEGEAQKVIAPGLIVWKDGDAIRVRALEEGARLLVVSALPLHEPVARYGPFVMNTREEIEQALDDLRRGTFVKE